MPVGSIFSHLFLPLSWCPLNLLGWWRFFEEIRPWIHHHSSRPLEGTVLWVLTNVYVYGFEYKLSDIGGTRRTTSSDIWSRKQNFSGYFTHGKKNLKPPIAKDSLMELTYNFPMLNFSFNFRALVARMWLIYVSRHCMIQPLETKVLMWVAVYIETTETDSIFYPFQEPRLKRSNLWSIKKKSHGSLKFLPFGFCRFAMNMSLSKE